MIDTITYEVDPNTGEVTPTKVRTYGTTKESTTEKKPVPSPVVYEADKNRDKGTPDERVEGEPGEDTITTTYTIDPNTGEIKPTVGKPVRMKDPTPTVVKVGAKDKVVGTPIEPTVVYEKDDTRDEGTPNITIPGKKGKTVTTTTYDVNPKDGTVTEKVGEPVITPAGVTKIKVGAKTKIEIIKDGGKTIQRTTLYDVDSKTGKVTHQVDEQIVGDNGAVTPPTVELPEYTGAIGGSLDGEGNVVAPPTFDKPIYKGDIELTVDRHVIQPRKRYVGDDTKELGEETSVFGKPGLELITTIYDVNPETGAVTERTEKKLSVVPTETVITKGTKPTVKIIVREGKVYEQTTTYKVNEKTGDVSSSMTEKYIRDVEIRTEKHVEPSTKTTKPVEKSTEIQKQLPNTGDAGALASLAGLVVGLLGVRLARKRDE